ncbi:MAG: type II toxin-antitoxin system VapC family toxin [Actinomycetota bacterium]|nr:type II toxin-antitoxin system VapC family toxin [Actinomycetota bacterium]
MTLYADSSALLKRFVREPESEDAGLLLRSDSALVTGRHTLVEVRRNLARLLQGRQLTAMRAAFTSDVKAFAIVELDAETCELAATIAEQSGVRTLDALHLACARRLGRSVTFLTYDLAQSRAATTLGLRTAGV